ncbi:MAG: hypothetical protein ACERLM_06180 [Acidimicrobiales bacterium]
MQLTTNDHLSMTSLLLAFAVVAISVAGVIGNSTREAAGEVEPIPTGSHVERVLVPDIPVKGDLAVSIVELGESSAYVVPDGTEPTVAIENGSGALVAAYGDRGRTVGLALVPPFVPADVRSIAITVDTTALALVGLTAGLVSVDARDMAAIWAVASATPEYAELTDEIESAMRLNFDLAEPPPAVAAAAAATVDATLAALADATPPVEVDECETETIEGSEPGPGACVRQRGEQVFVENALPRWGQLVPAETAVSLEARCSLVPPASRRVLLDDPVRDEQLEEHLARVVGSGKPDELASVAAAATLGGAGEVSVLAIELGTECPKDLLYVAPGAEDQFPVRSRQSQLLTVLTEYTAPLGPYLGGVMRSGDPVGAILDAPNGSIEAVVGLQADLADDDIDLSAISSTGPDERAARNRAIVDTGLAGLLDTGTRSAIGLQFELGDPDERPVRLSCDECEVVTAFEPLGLTRLTRMLGAIGRSSSTAFLDAGDGAGVVGFFVVDDGTPPSTTTSTVPITTTTVAPPVTAPPPTPPPTGPPITVITRVSFSLSYPTMDGSGTPLSITFTANNTGTDTIVFAPSNFWLGAAGAFRIPPTGADFTTLTVAPGEQKQGRFDFDPPPGPTPDTLGVTTPKPALEIPL